MNWHVGCSGFHYKEWKDVFYPEGLAQKKWFDFYSSRFDTIELNVTFYRYPRLADLQNWYDKSPANFLFAVKAPRFITHYRKFVDSEQQLQLFYGTIKEGLKEKLGPILFQLPPGLPYSEEKTQQIIQVLDKAFLNVIECRHASWWNKKVYAAFRKNNICFCSHSYPGLPDDVIQTTDILYYRFHGVPKLYYSTYSKEFLKKIIDAILRSSVKTSFIYFNNTAGVGAIENADYIKKFIKIKHKKTLN